MPSRSDERVAEQGRVKGVKSVTVPRYIQCCGSRRRRTNEWWGTRGGPLGDELLWRWVATATTIIEGSYTDDIATIRKAQHPAPACHQALRHAATYSHSANSPHGQDPRRSLC